MNDESQKNPEERAARDGAKVPNGKDAILDRGFAALRQLRDSTKAEVLPERLRAVVEKLRRQG